MDKLIEALQIFLKYDNPQFPTHCEHDQLFVNVNPALVSREDQTKLETLGFIPNDDGFISFKYGSC